MIMNISNTIINAVFHKFILKSSVNGKGMLVFVMARSSCLSWTGIPQGEGATGLFTGC